MAMFVWVIGLFGYVCAVINRTSLASLGLEAQHHFGIEATALSSFVVLQLVVYAGAQIPVGALIDRFGSAPVMVAGLFFMTVGQTVMALADTLGGGLIARGLVGVGDAGIFVALVRLMANWMPPQRMPVVTQMTGLVGLSGQFVSVTPLALVVSGFGWQTGYLALAAVTAVAAAASFTLLREFYGGLTLFERAVLGRRVDTPETEILENADGRVRDALGDLTPVTEPIPIVGRRGTAWKTFIGVVRRPGARLGFWAHFTPAAALNSFLLLWGTPFLRAGQGLSAPEAGGILMTAITVAMISGPFIGMFTSRYPKLRVPYVFVLTLLIAIAWLTVLLLPGGAPLWLLLLTAFFTGLGGPSSLVGLEVVRSHVHRRQLGLASGFVNGGSFMGGLLMILFIGLLLDWQGAGSPETYNHEAFRNAMLSQFLVWGIGLVGIAVEFPKARREICRRRGDGIHP
ncbi:MFS transporter [Canibacter zhoujuaniae]|nr:MFS transporter [Canibacter zhoujuaniae]